MRLAEAADPIVVIAAKTADPTGIAAWLTAYRSVVEAAAGCLWEIDGPSPPLGSTPGHTHVALVPGPRIDDHDRMVDQARADGDLPGGHAEVRRATWRPVGGTVLEPVDAEALVLAEVLCTDPARAREWDRWYDTQHLPDMLATGAFVAGSRWRREPPEQHGTNHLTIYEIAGLDLTDAVERSAAALPGLEAAGRKHGCHTGGPTMALRRAS